jgi:hypothetical protein
MEPGIIKICVSIDGIIHIPPSHLSVHLHRPLIMLRSHRTVLNNAYPSFEKESVVVLNDRKALD